MTIIQAIRVTETGKFWGGSEMLAGVTVEGLNAEWHAVLPVAEAAAVVASVRRTNVLTLNNDWMNVTEAEAQYEMEAAY